MKIFLPKKSFKQRLLFILLLSPVLYSPKAFSTESLNYSGRLIQSNGSQVVGPLTIRAQLT